MKTIKILLLVCLFGFTVSGLFARGDQAVSSQMETQKITYWVQLSEAVVAGNFNNLGETPFGQGLMERTGVNVEFIHPPWASWLSISTS